MQTKANTVVPVFIMQAADSLILLRDIVNLFIVLFASMVQERTR